MSLRVESYEPIQKIITQKNNLIQPIFYFKSVLSNLQKNLVGGHYVLKNY